MYRVSFLEVHPYISLYTAYNVTLIREKGKVESTGLLLKLVCR